MKVGYRKPSFKKSLAARTTGKYKRRLKRAINPYDGKKGTGMITNPKKAMYNKVYNKTTTSVFDTFKQPTKSRQTEYTENNVSFSNHQILWGFGTIFVVISFFWAGMDNFWGFLIVTLFCLYKMFS